MSTDEKQKIDLVEKTDCPKGIFSNPKGCEMVNYLVQKTNILIKMIDYIDGKKSEFTEEKTNRWYRWIYMEAISNKGFLNGVSYSDFRYNFLDSKSSNKKDETIKVLKEIIKLMKNKLDIPSDYYQTYDEVDKIFGLVRDALRE